MSPYGNYARLRDRDLLRRRMRERDITTRDLAALCKVAHGTIGMLCSGERNRVKEDVAIRIAKRLDLRYDDLFMSLVTHETRDIAA